MRRAPLFGAVALISCVVTLVGAPPAATDDFRCMGEFVTAGDFDNVIVPEGGFCDISNSTIKGNIKALRNSVLRVSGGNMIGGSVEGDNAFSVSIFNFSGRTPNVIQGNGVMVENTNSASVCGAVLPHGNITIAKVRGQVLNVGGAVGAFAGCAPIGGGNRVERGNIKVEDSVITHSFDVSNNLVAQNLQVYKNEGSASKLVANNIVGESVQCFDNTLPFVGGPNVAPEKEGQCF